MGDGKHAAGMPSPCRVVVGCVMEGSCMVTADPGTADGACPARGCMPCSPRAASGGHGLPVTVPAGQPREGGWRVRSASVAGLKRRYGNQRLTRASAGPVGFKAAWTRRPPRAGGPQKVMRKRSRPSRTTTPGVPGVAEPGRGQSETSVRGMVERASHPRCSSRDALKQLKRASVKAVFPSEDETASGRVTQIAL